MKSVRLLFTNSAERDADGRDEPRVQLCPYLAHGEPVGCEWKNLINCSGPNYEGFSKRTKDGCAEPHQ